MATGRWKGLVGRRPQIIVIYMGLLLGPGSPTVVTGGQPEEAIRIAQTKLLSDRGSTRATRYAGTNKIVTIDGKTWNSFCPSELTGSRVPLNELAFDGSLAIDSQDRIYVALTHGSRVTGGIKGDVVLLYSADLGKSFEYVKVFPPDARLPHTGLSLERFTGHNRVETPWLLFSTGEKGPDCFGKGIFHRVHAVEWRISP